MCQPPHKLSFLSNNPLADQCFTGVKVNIKPSIDISCHQLNSLTLVIFLFLKISRSPSGIKNITSGNFSEIFFKDLISR